MSGVSYSESAVVRDADIRLYASARAFVRSLPPDQAKTFSAYLPQMTMVHKTQLLTIWRTLDAALKNASIPYFFIGGEGVD
jgi:hypothetical protein